jgi:hypothetical protein
MKPTIDSSAQPSDTARDLLESIVLWVESTALEHRIPAAVKHARRFLDQTEPSQPVEAVDERGAFEAWVRNHFKYPKLEIDPRYPGYYADKLTAGAWEAWQERATFADPRPTQGGWTVIPDYPGVDAIVSALYRRFKKWAARGFGPDDVTWCEVKADVLALIDAYAPTGEQAGEVVEPKWPGPWNGHHFPVDAIAQVFGKAAFEAAGLLRLGPPNHSDIGFALLQQLGQAGFGVCRDTQPRPVGVPDGWKLVPVDATRAMIDAAARAEEDGYEAMHKAMLAAAPTPEVR